MKIIHIEDPVYAALEKQAHGFNQTPNTVISQLLARLAQPPPDTQPVAGSNGAPGNPFLPLLTSDRYKQEGDIGRYLLILAFLHQHHGEAEFAPLDGLRLSTRVVIASSPEIIEASGKKTRPKQIPGTRFFALSNLSRKENVLSMILERFGYQKPVIDAVLHSVSYRGCSDC